MPFFERIKPLWDKSPLTLAELAALCNISESSASRYLNGKITPPADTAERIIQVLSGETASEEEGEDEVKTEVQNASLNALVTHVREIYQAQIVAMQASHASHISAMQESHAHHVTDLRKFLLILFITVLILIGLLVYFILDGLHGNWGIIRYAMAEGGVR